MNAAETHLLINHIPVFGTLFGFLALLIGLIIHSDGAKKVGLIFLIIAGITSIAANNTGEEAEEIVEHMGLEADIHDYIHEHEELAEGAMKVSLVTGVIALLALYMLFKKKSPAKLLIYISLAGSLGGSIYMAYVSHTGGEIRHTEIRPGFELPEDDHHEEGHHDDD